MMCFYRKVIKLIFANVTNTEGINSNDDGYGRGNRGLPNYRRLPQTIADAVNENATNKNSGALKMQDIKIPNMIIKDLNCNM